MEKSSPEAVTIYTSSKARAIARSARQVARKQLAQFRRPRRMAMPVDLDGLMKEYGIPSTLSEEQRTACKAVGLEMKLEERTITLNRKQALNLAKDRAGIPHSQQPSRQWQAGDDITKKGGNYSNYGYNANPTHHGTYYEYDTPQGKKIIVDHTNDVQQGLHTHAVEIPKAEINPSTYDFKTERYSKIKGPNENHHIYYK